MDAALDPKHNEYANKQSAQVNAALDYGGPTKDEGEVGMTETTATNSGLTSNAPAVDVDFSALDVPANTSPLALPQSKI